MQKFCQANIVNFWLPSSPDRNSLVSAVQGILEHAINKTTHDTVNTLKAAIKNIQGFYG